MLKTVLVVLLFVSCVHCAAKIEVVSQYIYKQNNIYFVDTCDYTDEPCALLNDVWGYETEIDGNPIRIAIVGLANGIDFVNVTDPEQPHSIKFIQGCINLWRDFKVWGNYVYGITEFTPTCNCAPGDACLESMTVHEPASIAGKYPATEGRITVQLSTTGPISGELIPVEPWDENGCNTLTNPAELNGNIALIPFVGQCNFATKIMNAQDAGAIAVVIINDIDLIVYPAMNGDPTGITLPGVLVGYEDGQSFKDTIEAGDSVNVTLSSADKIVSKYFSPPEGLTVVDMTDVADPRLVGRWTQDFNFSHNLFIEWDRPYLYVCGMSDQAPGQDGFADLSNGGLFAYDLQADPENPPLIAVWNDSYVHDMMVHKCDGSYIMFAAGIVTDYVYIFNVTDPHEFVELNRYHARQGAAHNIWVDDACRVMYVTHEAANEPITVWALREFADGSVNWQGSPKYLGQLAINQFNGTLPHNVFVLKDELWASYYSEGVAVWDIEHPRLPTLIDQYDTSPYTGGSMGVWGVYPYTTDGMIYASDMTEGLFVMRLVESGDSSDGNEGRDGDDEDDALVPTIFSVIFAITTAIAVIVAIVFGVLFYRATRSSVDYTNVPG